MSLLCYFHSYFVLTSTTLVQYVRIRIQLSNVIFVQYSVCLYISFFSCLPVYQRFVAASVHLPVVSIRLFSFTSCLYLFLFIYQSFILVSISLLVVSTRFYSFKQSYLFISIHLTVVSICFDPFLTDFCWVKPCQFPTKLALSKQLATTDLRM